MEDTLAGQTFYDFLDRVLTDRRRFAALLALCLVFVAGFVLIVGGMLRLFGLRPQEAKITALGNTFAVSLEHGSTTEYLLVVPPQGWLSTGVPVKAGQTIDISASGRVCIDLHGLIQTEIDLHEFEQEAREKNLAQYGSNDQAPNATRAPEDSFTEEQLKKLELIDKMWLSPAGDTSPRLTDPQEKRQKRPFIDQEYPARTEHKLLPDAPYGALVGTVTGDIKKEPDRTATVFAVGESNKVSAPRAGLLWLSVNDVVREKAPKPLFFFDNLGYFLVKITITG